MRSIAIINQKGGVGKTTTAVHVAAALARAGQRVLLIDLDPQSHASLHFGVQLGPNEPGVYDVLLRDVPPSRAFHNVNEHLVLLPGGIDLVGAELELRERAGREHVLANALAPLAKTFGLCLIDCPPSLGLLTVNALVSVDEVIIPLQAHFLALQGLGRLLETVTLVRRALNPRLRVSGVALCMYEKGTRLAQEVLDDVTQFVEAAAPTDAWYGARIFETRIRRNVKLAECPSFGQTVFDYAPGSNGAIDYLALADEVGRVRAGATPGTACTSPVSKPAAEIAMPGSDAAPAVGSAAPSAALESTSTGSSSPVSELT